MEMTETTNDASRKRALLIVFLVVVIDLLGFGIVLPLAPRYVKDFAHHMSETAQGLLIGALMSSFSFMQFLFAPLWGRISDRIGRRPVLIVGLIGSVLFYALFGYASAFPSEQANLALTLMFVSRIGAGLFGATIATAAAVIADNTPKEQRAKGMALIGAAFGIGFTIGPLIAFAGEKLFPDARSGPGYLAAVLSFIALVLAIRLMPETNQNRSVARGMTDLWRLGSLWALLRTRHVGLLIVIFFMAVFAFANFEGTLSLLNQSAFNLGNDWNYIVFAFVGASLMVAQGYLYRKWVTTWGEVKLARIGIVLMLVGLANLAGVAATASATQSGFLRFIMMTWFLATLFIAVCGFAFLNPSMNALISKRTDADKQGEVLGANQSASALARILGPAVGNGLFPLTTRHELPYVVAAGLLLVVLLLSPKLGESA